MTKFEKNCQSLLNIEKQLIGWNEKKVVCARVHILYTDELIAAFEYFQFDTNFVHFRYKIELIIFRIQSRQKRLLYFSFRANRVVWHDIPKDLTGRIQDEFGK